MRICQWFIVYVTFHFGTWWCNVNAFHSDEAGGASSAFVLYGAVDKTKNVGIGKRILSSDRTNRLTSSTKVNRAITRTLSKGIRKIQKTRLGYRNSNTYEEDTNGILLKKWDIDSFLQSFRSSEKLRFTLDGPSELTMGNQNDNEMALTNITTLNDEKYSSHESNNLAGSAVRYLNSNDIFQDMELLPFKEPMLEIKGLDKPKINRKSDKKFFSWRRSKRSTSHTRDNSKLKMPWRRVSSHPERIQRIERDMRYMAVSIASNINSPDQWKELIENGGGVFPILECIHDATNDIETISKHEQNRESDFIKSEDDLIIISLAIKTLRDLAAIDKNWAVIITEEILKADTAWRQSSRSNDGILSDLVKVLQYANQRPTRKRLDALRHSGVNRGRKRFATRRQQRMARRRCSLYITQLLLSLAIASDEAISQLCDTDGLIETVRLYSSYGKREKLRRRWIRYPWEVLKRKLAKKKGHERPFLAAAAVPTGMRGEIQSISNQLLAALGYNEFVPKVPGQKGLRILCLDGGGTRGITAISTMQAMVDAMGGSEVCDTFDIIAGTSTGAIIAFLVGLRRESSGQARRRYEELIERIFVKSALSVPMLFLTTAAYSEEPFKKIMEEILGDYSMLNSRGDPRVPLVFAVSSKMSSTTGKCCLFRNYNYGGGQAKPDKFVITPKQARSNLGFKVCEHDYSDHHHRRLVGEGSRYEGSFRVLQRAALQATTAAPTYFKPVQMNGEMYSDGGIVASNPTCIAIHEARRVFPNTPIELIVSCGTGDFIDEQSTPSFGWDGIIGQIVKSATDTGRTHHILQDILGKDSTANTGSSIGSMTKYFRFDPMIGTPTDFPIDGTDKKKLEALSQITSEYMQQPEQQESLSEISKILAGERSFTF